MQIKRYEEQKQKKTVSQPTIGQLKAWECDEITQWIFKKLNSHFPDYRQSLPLRLENDGLILNYQVGSRAVLEAIERLIEHGEI